MSTRVKAIAERVRYCRMCGAVIPMARARRAYCSERCRKRGDAARHRERYKAKSDIYSSLGLHGQSTKPCCDALVAAGYDRYCPVCERNYKPGEERRCKCNRPLQPIEWHLAIDWDWGKVAAAVERGFV